MISFIGYIGNTNSDSSNYATVYKFLETAPKTEGTITIPVPANGAAWLWLLTRQGVPNNAAWEAGTWTQLIFVVSITASSNTNITAAGYRETVGNPTSDIEWTSDSTPTGNIAANTLYTLTIPTKSWASGLTTNRLGVWITFTNTNNKATTVVIKTGTLASASTTTPIANKALSWGGTWGS